MSVMPVTFSARRMDSECPIRWSSPLLAINRHFTNYRIALV